MILISVVGSCGLTLGCLLKNPWLMALAGTCFWILGVMFLK